jgi:hypothetical protein
MRHDVYSLKNQMNQIGASSARLLRVDRILDALPRQR